MNPRLRDIVVYDFSYHDQELKMGGHWGNRFSIILRSRKLYLFLSFVPVQLVLFRSVPPETRDILVERLQEFEKDGFINYFGTFSLH